MWEKKNQSHKEEMTGKKPKEISAYVAQIHEVFGVDVATDQQRVHPRYFCKLCYKKLFYTTKHTAYKWTPHPLSDDIECEVCATCTYSLLKVVGQENHLLAAQQSQTASPLTIISPPLLNPMSPPCPLMASSYYAHYTHVQRANSF